ncbi:hypothetical protein [Streptomyces sp. NPDC001604]|uniref:hypothetical protein n=1 Tax=Streptomyces sp. NPDC001604 TaxID=3364593 RepID=UPI003681D68C
MTARTLGELAVLTVDLPGSAAEVTGKDVDRIEQLGASARRGGRVVPRRLEIGSEWGEVRLDFTEAVITHDTLHIGAGVRLRRGVPRTAVDRLRRRRGWSRSSPRPFGAPSWRGVQRVAGQR